ncbi:hypothetical protein LTR97_005170 [Elasticomyces elasticus]|uniref:Uncharacterized protein n=1 Tax=Elasticomyces elasticus TaxID=574655 RepID=A0AAN7W9Q5_9PEZI|nr:hypothetical protein LTR97_005170 [Elasticomyces elasticus]
MSSPSEPPGISSPQTASPRRLESTDDDSQRHLQSHSTASTTLKRSYYILWIVALYTALSVVSWGIICVLTERPLYGKRYGYMSSALTLGKSRWRKPDYEANERWYQAMRVIQSITGVLTIPVTSAVCSSAAAAFAQYGKSSTRLSMRQMIVLADRGWTDPRTFTQLLTWTGFKRTGSTFLVLAILLNILGGLIQPLQQIFLKDIAMKTPLYRIKLYHLFDVTDAFNYGPEQDDGSVVLMTRNALATTSLVEPMNQLWQGAGFSCDARFLMGNDTASTERGSYESPPAACGYGATLGNYSGLTEPFFAQQPSTFSTGVIRQFLPRFNSTSTYNKITANEWPTACTGLEDAEPGSYMVVYAKNGTDTVNPWAVTACMPSDQRHTPWKRTHSRQDFGEELYLNVTRADAGQVYEPGGSLFQIIVNTTAGYFELPNYNNGQVPGPLLADDPNNHCDSYCETQGMLYDFDETDGMIYDGSDPKSINYKRAVDKSDISSLAQVPNKGPLLTIAMALFGEGSFIAERVAYPDKYITDGNNGSLPNGTCVDYAPLQFIQHITYGYGIGDGSEGQQCVVNNDTTTFQDLQGGISLWLRYFQANDAQTMQNALNAAAYLATKAWVEHQVQVAGRSLTVSMDMGTDTQVPSISPAGMYIISILLAIFLLSLLAMALYSTWQVRWTRQLDAFAMMRVGAAVKDQVPMLVGGNAGKISSLDRMPGWVGDEEPSADIGTLGVGSRNALQKGRRYHSYEGDDEPWPTEIKGGREAYMEVRMEELRHDLKDDRRA